VFETLRSKWERLGTLAKAGLVVGVSLILAVMVLGGVWLLSDDYQVLFADLNTQDASAMVSELDRMKVPYRLSEGGTAILVERDAVYKTRLKLMGKGLDLHGGVGFEIFNNADFGMTEFAQKVNFQRALQGELARTVMGFDEVKSARVHLVLPESGLFKRQNAKPKASISLVMKGGNQLQPEQISGIQRLVAASVPEIDAAAVTIVDQHGIAVSKAISDDTANDLSARLETKRQIEEYLTRKIVAVLDRAVGPGRAIVSVDALLNYDQVKVTKEDILPLPNTSGQSVGAITKRRDSVQGGDPFGELLATGGGDNRAVPATPSASTSSEVEFLNGRRVEQIVSPSGGIRRLSVGVMVPDISDPVELAKLKEVVTMAAGVNMARGDAIVVYNHTPPASHENAPQEPLGQAELPPLPANDESARHVLPFSPTATHIISGAGILLALAGGLLLWNRRRANESKKRLNPEQRDRLLQEVIRWAAAEKA